MLTPRQDVFTVQSGSSTSGRSIGWGLSITQTRSEVFFLFCTESKLHHQPGENIHIIMPNGVTHTLSHVSKLSIHPVSGNSTWIVEGQASATNFVACWTLTRLLQAFRYEELPCQDETGELLINFVNTSSNLDLE